MLQNVFKMCVFKKDHSNSLSAKDHLKTYKESMSYDYLNKDQEGATLNAFSVGNVSNECKKKDF